MYFITIDFNDNIKNKSKGKSVDPFVLVNINIVKKDPQAKDNSSKKQKLAKL